MQNPLGLTANMPSEAALATILVMLGQDFDHHIGLFLNSTDPDSPRKARVALRRLTTALEAFAPLLRKSRAAHLRLRAKVLFRLLGNVRDDDVVGQLSPGSEAQDMLRDRTRKSLRKAKALTFGPRLCAPSTLKHLLKTGRSARRRRSAPLVQTASAALEAARNACLKNGTDLSRLSEAKAHDLRKRLKSWRYLAEFFSTCWPEDQDAAARRALFQELQDAMGVMTDQALLRQRGKPVDLQAVSAAQSRAQDLLCRLILEQPWWRAASDPAPT